MLYLLVGKSASGKDTLADNLFKKYGLEKVLSKTTRKPRYKGEVTHTFISDEQAIEEKPYAIAYTFINGCHYYTTKEDLEGKDIYIIDEKGVEYFKYWAWKNNFTEYETIYLKVGFFTRLSRMIKRGDKAINIVKRLWHDSRSFKKMDKYADVITNKSELVEKYILKNI